MRIGVVGTGYVGLVAGACLAESGDDVVWLDRNESNVRTLTRGGIPLDEPSCVPPVIFFDERNLVTPDQMKQSGFADYSIGRN